MSNPAYGRRRQLLKRFERRAELSLLLLSFVWIGLILLDLIQGLSPALERTMYLVWAIFIVDFAAKLSLAPNRLRFLRRNVLTALALIVPALRVLRVLRVARLLRAARAARGLRLASTLSGVSRSFRIVRAFTRRRGIMYVLLLTLFVTLLGAAGMKAFEPELDNYPTALWWTAMILTTMGSEYWPETAEGRILCLLLAVYAFSVFGYVTASIASVLVGIDQEERALKQLHEEIGRLREEVYAVSAMVQRNSSTEGRSEQNRAE